MGITARGAWVSVQRHFRERGINVQTDVISVIGIGDMAGDVFGNGLLMSETLQLVAAFNHLHIFIDPIPDLRAVSSSASALSAFRARHWTVKDLRRFREGVALSPVRPKESASRPRWKRASPTKRTR